MASTHLYSWLRSAQTAGYAHAHAHARAAATAAATVTAPDHSPLRVSKRHLARTSSSTSTGAGLVVTSSGPARFAGPPRGKDPFHTTRCARWQSCGVHACPPGLFRAPQARGSRGIHTSASLCSKQATAKGGASKETKGGPVVDDRELLPLVLDFFGCVWHFLYGCECRGHKGVCACVRAQVHGDRGLATAARHIRAKRLSWAGIAHIVVVCGTSNERAYRQLLHGNQHGKVRVNIAAVAALVRMPGSHTPCCHNLRVPPPRTPWQPLRLL